MDLSWKVKLLAFLLRIKIVEDNSLKARGRWNYGRKVILNDKAKDIDALHEIGHYLNDYDCCREHDEWRAHGFTIAIAKLLKIKKEQIDEMEKRMNVYANLKCHCPRIDEKTTPCKECEWRGYSEGALCCGYILVGGDTIFIKEPNERYKECPLDKFNTEKKIEEYRNEIDKTDQIISSLILRRFKIAKEIGRIKKKNNIPIYVPERENEILESIKKSNFGEIKDESLEKIFKVIIKETRSLENG